MNSPLENISPTTDNHTASDDGRKKSPPAFLDLADSAARLGSNMPDMSARVELKRLEHERQRALQRKLFEDQMRALEEQQAQELLNIPFDAGGNGGMQHLAVSAPTTPPRVSAMLAGEIYTGRNGRIQHSVDAETLSKAVGTVADKRKSVTYAPTVNLSPDLATAPVGNGHGFSRSAGAKSMPASRRTSASEHDEELASHLQGLSLATERSTRASPGPGPASASIVLRSNSRYNNDEGARYATTYNPGMMLDEQLDQEMHNAMRNLPTSDDDKYHNTFSSKVSKSSAALDLAQLSQQNREKSAEWPHFNGNRGPEGIASRPERRTVTNPNLTLSTPSDDFSIKPLGGNASASSTPLVVEPPQHAQFPVSLSGRGSPPGLMDNLSTTTRSVPTTPLGLPATTTHLLKSGSPLTPDLQPLSARIGTPGSQHVAEAHSGSNDLQASLSRLPSGTFENGGLNFNTMQPSPDDYGLESPYSLGGSVDGSRYNASTGSTALYQQNSPRFGLGLGVRTGASAQDGKMNGLHGPKHRRDMDREFNRFTGTRLEDLQGEIATLCKDQHGCRYLQKKLEEGLAEHRDMIFRETFNHFAELMTDPFGNYLCQKLLEFATDEQRNLICESVAQDLVNISLNMHGTRAVQKMIDFLSTRRQIHSIILALSLHVVALIKDLNGNHVVQKCLNKLAPEDNQFIYNAVAANCVEVATHRHGCCVLQRCIDHASDHQRIQLVNEITYNALTLVQDPYGNYVVQYILDLNDSRFSDAVIRQFQGNVCALSVQKFSSNVIEKCVRVAEHSTRKTLIDELLNRSRLEKLLRDSYGNYCVQTALDYAEPAQRALLVEGIRPVLPLIRNTPYGKRIQNKLQREAQNMEYGTFRGHDHLVSVGLTNQGLSPSHTSGRHLAQGLQGSLSDVYVSNNNVYGLTQTQAGFAQAHLTTPLPGSVQPQSIDGYVLQSTSSHNQGIGPHNGFNGGSFNDVSPSIGAVLTGSLSDPYRRSAFGGYGM